MKSSDIFTVKGTSLRESTSLEPLCVKIGWRVLVVSRAGPEKNEEVTGTPMKMRCRL